MPLREERMNLEIAVVSAQNLGDLPVFRLFPYGCQYCLYWESTGDFDEKVDKAKAQQLKVQGACEALDPPRRPLSATEVQI